MPNEPIGREVDSGLPANVNLRSLIGSHLGVIANSGAGKSGFIRKLLEATYGEVQQLVLDPDDDYYTLREAGDYLIAGDKESDFEVTLANAAALADLLLKSEMSAVVGLNHLRGDGPQMVVAAILNALMEAPRDLWRPILIVIDEAHRFIPQDTTTEASEAVRELLARGRKRGFTAVVATQRMATIEKHATANINNWAFGRVGQATDRRVVSDMLGWSATSPQAKGLPALASRHFWIFGPGLQSLEPTLMVVDQTRTTIIEAGQPRAPMPAAPEDVRKLLASIPATPPAQKSGEAAPGASEADLRAARAEGYSAGREEGYRAGRAAAISGVQGYLNEVAFDAPDPAPDRVALLPVAPPLAAAAAAPPRADPTKISRAVQSIIATYQAIYPRAIPFRQAAQLAGVGMRSSQFRTYEPELLELGIVEDVGNGRYRALEKVGSPDDMLQRVVQQLSPKQAAILAFIRRAGRPVTKDEIVAGADVSPTSSTTGATLSMLINEAGVVEKVGDDYQMGEAFR